MNIFWSITYSSKRGDKSWSQPKRLCNFQFDVFKSGSYIDMVLVYVYGPAFCGASLQNLV